MVTYKRTKAGQWVVSGPTSIVRSGATVTVSKRDGTTKVERIASTGRPFGPTGQEQVYGYLATRGSSPRRNRQEEDHEDCLSFAGGCGPRCPYSFVGR